MIETDPTTKEVMSDDQQPRAAHALIPPHLGVVVSFHDRALTPDETPRPAVDVGDGLLMEFIGDDDGTAAPRLAQASLEPELAEHLWEQARHLIGRLAASGRARGDPSPYDIFVDGS